MKTSIVKKLLRTIAISASGVALCVGLSACNFTPNLNLPEEPSSSPEPVSEIVTEAPKSFASRVVGTYSEKSGDEMTVLTVCNVYGNLYAERVFYQEDAGDYTSYAYEAVEIIPVNPADLEDETKTECEVGIICFSGIYNAGMYPSAPVRAKISLTGSGLVIDYEEGTLEKEEYIVNSDVENVFAYKEEVFAGGNYVALNESLEGIWRQKDTDSPVYLDIRKSGDDSTDAVQIYQKARGTEVLFGRGFLKEDASGLARLSYKTINSYSMPYDWTFRYEAGADTLTIRTDSGSYNDPLEGRENVVFEKIESSEIPVVAMYEPDDKNAYAGELSYKTANGKERAVQAQFFACDDIENNGGYFVRVGKLIFYRFYDNKKIDGYTGFFGSFLDMWFLQDASCVCYYDPETKETGVAFKDNGRGPLYYLNGWFISEVYEPDDTSSINSLMKCWPDGSGVAPLAADGYYNYVLDVSDDGQYIAYMASRISEVVSTRGFVDSDFFDIGKNEYMEIARYLDHDLFMMVYNKEGNLDFYMLYEDERELQQIGTYVVEKPYQTGYPYVEQVYRSEENGDIYAGLMWIDTSGVVEGLTVLEMEDRADGEVKILFDEYPEACKNGGLPYFYFNYADEVLIRTEQEGSVCLSEGKYGDLIYSDSAFSAVILASGYITEDPWKVKPEETVTYLEKAELVGGNAFIIRTYLKMNTELGYSIRPQYDLQRYEYSVIPMDSISGDGSKYEEILLTPEMK